MSETKRMHYVPKTYLKYFSDRQEKNTGDEYFIHVLPKPLNIDHRITKRNTKKVCVKNNIYTLNGAREQERQFLEEMYSTLYEEGYDNLYKILTDEKREILTPTERYSIISFVVSMFYRNNSWSNGHNRFMDEMYAKAYHLSKVNGHDSFFMEEEEISIANRTLEQMQKDSHKENNPAMALLLAEKTFQLSRLRLTTDVVTIVKVIGDFEFITSDNPVTFRNEGTKCPIPFDPTNTLSLPIDNKHLLQLRPWAHELDVNMIGRVTVGSFIAGVHTATNNQFQLGQSGTILLGTETGLNNFQQKPLGILSKT